MDWSLGISIAAVVVSILSALRSIQVQKRLVRIQGSEIYRKRAEIVERMLLKYRAYGSDLKAFTQAKDKETFWKHAKNGADTLIDIYHRFTENDLYFNLKERKRIYKGADALETMHRLLRDSYGRYWDVKDSDDPQNDARLQAINTDLKNRQKTLEGDIHSMHRLLMRLIGLK